MASFFYKKIIIAAIINMEVGKNCWRSNQEEAADSTVMETARKGTDPEKAESRCTTASLGIDCTVGIHTGACSEVDRCSPISEALPGSFDDLFELALSILD